MIRARAFAPYLLFAAITVAMTLPVVRAPASVLPNDAGDPALNTWILWWGGVALPLTPAFWDAPAFHPAGGALAFSEHLLGLWPLAAALRALGAGPQLVYNVVFLLSFPLSAGAAHALVHALTRRRDAALVAGLLYGFAPYRMAHVSHLQVLASWWLPLALLGLHRFHRDRRPGGLLLFALSFAAQALTNGYLLLFAPLLFAAWALWFATGPGEAGRRMRGLAAIAAAFLVAAVALVPPLLAYRSVHRFYGFERKPDEVLRFSADVSALLDPGHALAFWRGDVVPERPEGQLFPGALAPLLVALAVAGAARARGPGREVASERTWLLRTRLVLAVIAAAFALGAAGRAVNTTLEVLPAPPGAGSSRSLENARVALLSLAAALLLHPRLRHACRVRSALAFYVAATLLFWVLAFGPRVHWNGRILFADGPYALLLGLPGFESLRVPARFALLSVLALAVAAGLSFARLVPRDGRRREWVLGGAVVLALLDGWPRGIAAVEPPPSCPLLAGPGAEGPVLEVPVGTLHGDVAAMYRQMAHGRSLLNGYSGYAPPHYEELVLGLGRGDGDLLDEIASLGVRHVLVHERRKKGGRQGGWTRLLARHPGARVAGRCGDATLFRLPAPVTPLAAPAAPGDWGAPLELRGISSSVAPGELPLLGDADPGTRWHAPEQTGEEQIVVDLGEPRAVDGVVLALGPYRLEFPVELEVALSLDGRAFTVVRSGGGAGPAVRAAIADPRRIPAAYAVGGAVGRWVRLRQTGADPDLGWSVAELAVHGR